MSGLGLASHQSMIEKDGDYEDKISAADVFEHLTVCAMFAKVYLSLWH